MVSDMKNIYSAITKIAWGYFFVYFNFNFEINMNSIKLLPEFVGYLLFLSAIDLLKEEKSELLLLKGFGGLLSLWHLTGWVLSFVSIKIDGLSKFTDIIICIVNLYFHFQLLTNIASIAEKYQPDGSELDKKLLKCRTLQTVIVTSVMVITALMPWLEELWSYISIALILVYLVAGICLMAALFELRRNLPQDSPPASTEESG